MKKAVISLSGGLDSTMLMMRLLADGYQVRAYSFNYGQKHLCELEKLKENLTYLTHEKGFPISWQVINLEDAFSDSVSSLKQGGEDIPEGHYKDENMKSTVVENRNVIFSSIIYGKALSWANKTKEHVSITLGIHAGDHTIYPDCTPESHEAAAHLFEISNWGSERVDYIAPYEYKTKGELLVDGIEAMEYLGLNEQEMKDVLYFAHTCYNPNENGESCGRCGSCTERLEAFEYAGQMINWLNGDPAPYQK